MINSDSNTKSTLTEVVKYPGCFVCGDENDSGLKLKFWWDGEVCRTEFVAAERFCGYHRLLHGGIVSTILDEVMIKAILAEGIVVVTVDLQVRFKAPVHTDDRLTFEAKVGERRKRLFTTNGIARLEDGRIAAEASARYIQVTGAERLAALTEQLSGPLN
ncbi:MAG: PaaI family thioesterase [Candidatus Zixiibacteriota bacterium]